MTADSVLPATGVSDGLEASRVTIRLDGTLIIDGVDCTVEPGTFSALLGPNGAGKSTLLSVLAAVEKADSGNIRFGGAELREMHRRQRARTVAFVEQEATTELALTVRDVVALGRTPYQSLWSDEGPDDAAIVTRAIELADMAPFASRNFVNLSGGERQRVLLAKALAQQPELLLLDEPTNHLDVSAQLSVLALLAELATTGVTVLAALHDLNLAAAYCDHVVVLRNGRVYAAGPTRSVLTPELVRDVYGVEASVLENPKTGRPVIAFSPLALG
ncbi:MAG: iron complex transport system ATP-binding protein [Microbacteriaceae bacterium]|nr:iron complex transport system ATP-binding protein [Microbacteriaceae bacterium]